MNRVRYFFMGSSLTRFDKEQKFILIKRGDYKKETDCANQSLLVCE